MIKNNIPIELWALKSPKEIEVKYITIHERKSGQSAENVVRFCTNDLRREGFHYAIDEKDIVEMIPPNKIAFACGDGMNGDGNNHSIQIEICGAYDYSSDRYYRAIENTVIFVKQLMNEYKIPIENIKKHQDWTGLNCPERMIKENLWEDFIKELKQDD